MAFVLSFVLAAAALLASLDEAARQYAASIVRLAPVTGRDVAYDYYERLQTDRDYLADPTIPDGYRPADYSTFLTNMAQLDIELVSRLEHADYGDISQLRGLHEILVRSSLDGTMQPSTLYVPSSYDPAHPAPLVVLLHGHPQTETSVLGQPYFATLAERTGSIVIAPYGRGKYDFAEEGVTDVYDAADAVCARLAVDPRRHYLVGYSMGGFSVFIVGPHRDAFWRALLSISGGIMGHDIPKAAPMLRATPLYVVTGTNDDSIPTEYTQRTAQYFANAGDSVSLYVHPGGTHRLVTNLNALTKAWMDMHDGVYRELQPAELTRGFSSSAPKANVIF